MVTWILESSMNSERGQPVSFSLYSQPFQKVAVNGLQSPSLPDPKLSMNQDSRS